MLLKKISALLYHIRDVIRLFTILFFMPWWAYIIEKIFNKELTFTNALLVIIMFVLFGGFWCGWLCPFGNLDYFISRIGSYLIPKSTIRKLTIPRKTHNLLGYLRYIFIIPFVYAGMSNIDTIGHTLARYGIHIYFLIKIITILIIPLYMPRFFCKYICFHRALANIINKILPLWRIQRNASTCISCSKCTKTCPMDIPIAQREHTSAYDCLFCFDCLDFSKTCSSHSKSLDLYFLRWKISPTILSILALIIYFSYYVYSVLLR